MRHNQWWSILLAGALLLSIAGCGKNAPPTGEVLSGAASEASSEVAPAPVEVKEDPTAEVSAPASVQGDEQQVTLEEGSNAANGGLDVSGYVKAVMDAEYLGQTQGYQDLLGASPEAAQQIYTDSILYAAEDLLAQYGCSDASQTAKTRAAKLFEEIYPQLKYEVGQATAGDNLYTVQITVHPLNLFSAHVDELSDYLEANEGKASDAMINGFLDLAEDYAKTVAYDAVQTILINVVPDENGAWQINPDDRYLLHSAVIAY